MAINDRPVLGREQLRVSARRRRENEDSESNQSTHASHETLS